MLNAYIEAESLVVTRMGIKPTSVPADEEYEKVYFTDFQHLDEVGFRNSKTTARTHTRACTHNMQALHTLNRRKWGKEWFVVVKGP